MTSPEIEAMERRSDEIAELPAATHGETWAAARDAHCVARAAQTIKRVGTSERSEA